MLERTRERDRQREWKKQKERKGGRERERESRGEIEAERARGNVCVYSKGRTISQYVREVNAVRVGSRVFEAASAMQVRRLVISTYTSVSESGCV